MKNNIFSKIISVFLIAVILVSSIIMVFALDSSLSNNKHWVSVNVSTVNSKYNSGSKFVLVVSKTGDVYSSRTNDLLSGWMDENNINIFNFTSSTGADIPLWVYDSISNGVYVTPMIIFVNNKKATGYSGCDDPSKYTALNNAFNSFYGITSNNCTGISVKTLPQKLLYKRGESFDPTGLVIYAEYSGGKKQSIYSGFTCSGFSSVKDGIIDVTVTYKSFKTSFEVIVSESQYYSYKVDYKQTDARRMLNMINELRTDKDTAWYWNETNTSKIKCPELKPLVYDYTLEQAAMQIAAELAVYYSHYRPNGLKCYSTVPAGYGLITENVACGYKGSDQMFNVFVEGTCDYLGQGHRRNMLSDEISCCAFACAEIDGYQYWVQLFGSPCSDESETSAVNKEKTVNVEILNVNTVCEEATYTWNTASMKTGETKAVPVIEAKLFNKPLFDSIKYFDPVPIVPSVPTVPDKKYWMSSNPAVVTVKDGVITALSAGTATIYIMIGNTMVSAEITVTGEPVVTESSTSVVNPTQPTSPSVPGSSSTKPTEPGSSTTNTTSPSKTNPTAPSVKPTTVDNPTAQTVIVASKSVSVDYKSKVVINASAKNLPSGYFVAIYDGDKILEKSKSSGSVKYITDNLSADKTYKIRVIDASGHVQKNAAGDYISQDMVIDVNTGFFAKIIAFFRGLFGSYPLVEI